MIMSRFRRNRNIIEDLELSLAPSHLSKRRQVIDCQWEFSPNLINIEDDDDDNNNLEILYAHPPGETVRFFPENDSWLSVLTEEDLELRLGPRAPRSSRSSSRLFNKCEDGVRYSQPWKHSKASCSRSHSKEVRLKCVVCMDTMKEETSTVCGHVFCKLCITDAILAQKRCPVCRLKLSISNIHPLYLPEVIL